MLRRKPLKSGKALMRKSPFVNTANFAIAKRRIGMKRRIKKPTVEQGSMYLAACRDKPCYLRVPGICIGSETVVPCHSNQAKHGKGMGIKAQHKFTVPGCRACHAWIDQGKALRENKFEAWDRAYARWEPARARKMTLEDNDAFGDPDSE